MKEKDPTNTISECVNKLAFLTSLFDTLWTANTNKIAEDENAWLGMSYICRDLADQLSGALAALDSERGVV